MSDNNLPDTKTVPGEAISAATCASADTSESNPEIVRPSSEPVNRTPESTGTAGLVGRFFATHDTASANDSRTRRNFKSVRPALVVAASIASPHLPKSSGQPPRSRGAYRHERRWRVRHHNDRNGSRRTTVELLRPS